MSDQFQNVQQIFARARELQPEERDGYLRDACGDDAELRSEVDSLLVVSEQETGDEFLGRPALGGATQHDIPERIGHYRIVDVLGEGGFAVVYLAEQTEPVRRRVALKIIKPGMDSRQIIARFEAERQALAIMEHPNVAKVFDAGATETGRPYFVIEHVPGLPITTYCTQQHLSGRERLDLFIQTCEAVQHAHQKGIIHRDIKPSNVLVTVKEGRPLVKVIDFGVAKAITQPLTARTLVTLQGQIIGTPAYMSPEQAEMGSLDIDTRSDVYSLGVLLYEMMVGAPPFDRETFQKAAFSEIQRILREEEPLRPSTRIATLGEKTDVAMQRELSGDLDWITMKAMEKDRTRRYDTAVSLADDIRRHLAYEPVLAGPPSAVYRMSKFVRRNRASVIGAVAVLVVLLVGIAATTWGLVEARAARVAEAEQRADAERQAAIARSINAFLNEDLLGAAAPERDGKDVTVLQVVDEASREIEGRFEDEPLVEAGVRAALGQTYLSLGRDDQAVPQFEKAVSLRRLAGHGDDAETAAILLPLGLAYRFAGRLDDAEAVLTEALDTCRSVHGEEHPGTFNAMHDLGGVLVARGRLDEAQPLYVAALDGRRRLHGDMHAETNNSINSLAGLYLRQGRLEEAEPLFRIALEGSREHHGPEHRWTLTSINNLALVIYRLKRFEEAAELYEQVLDARRRVLGDDHPETIGSYSNLGSLYASMGRDEEAAVKLLRGLALSREHFGDDHPETFFAMHKVAQFQHGTEQFAEARVHAEAAVAGARRILGDEHPFTQHYMVNLAKVCLGQDDLARAEAVAREALRLRTERLSEDHPTVADAQKLVDEIVEARAGSR